MEITISEIHPHEIMLHVWISALWAYSTRWPFEAPIFFLSKQAGGGVQSDNKMWAGYMFLKTAFCILCCAFFTFELFSNHIHFLWVMHTSVSGR